MSGIWAPVLFLVTACDSPTDVSCAGDNHLEDNERCEPPGEEADADADTGAVSADVPFGFGPVLACDAPVADVSYSEVGLEWGLAAPRFWMGEHAENGSVAVADFDLDRDLDVVMGFDRQPQFSTPVALRASSRPTCPLKTVSLKSGWPTSTTTDDST